MPAYLFDTMALIQIHEKLGSAPDAWRKEWDMVRKGNAKLVLPSVIITEIIEKMTPNRGLNETTVWIRRLIEDFKGNTVSIDRELATDAGGLKLRHGLSLADALILAVALKENASLFTSDWKLSRAAGSESVKCNYLPKSELCRK